MNSCSDVASNYYANGSTCRPCNSLCATCSGGQSYNCNSCASGKIELVDSPLKNPKHCLASCGGSTGTYLDGSNCKGKIPSLISLCFQLWDVHWWGSSRLHFVFQWILCPPDYSSVPIELSQRILQRHCHSHLHPV